MPILDAIKFLCFFLNIVSADSTFKSRPDLAPPKLNITTPCLSSNCESGYIFVTPFSGYADSLGRKPVQPGAYIITDSGDLVWSGFTYFSPWNANFQVARWKNQDVLFSFEGRHNGPHGHAHGHHTILNNKYETIRELRAGNHFLSDKHEFTIVNETTALIQIYHPLQMNLKSFGGSPNQTWIVDAIFQELSIETGDVVFEWHSLDHVSPNETMLPLPYGQAGSGHNSSSSWDYFHINSVKKGEDGHYLLSARHASTIFKINGSDGSVIWRLGGKHSDFHLEEGVDFGFQHDARYLPRYKDSVEKISLFDNSAYGSEGSANHTKIMKQPYSKGKYIALNCQNMSAALVQEFNPPSNSISSTSQGSLQTLPNGNVLINWGSEGQITEYSPTGDIVFHAHLDSGELADNIHSYRAFKYNWTGYSAEKPALKAEKSGNLVKMFVSWNGDTQTDRYRFSFFEKQKENVKLKKCEHVVKRTGFETFSEVRIEQRNFEATRVIVEAIGNNGQVLGISNSMSIVAAIENPSN